MQTRQQGGALGTLIVVMLLVAGGYYAYTEFFSTTKTQPSCKQTLNSCIAACRKTSTEAPALQACQESCQRDAATCK